MVRRVRDARWKDTQGLFYQGWVAFAVDCPSLVKACWHGRYKMIQDGLEISLQAQFSSAHGDLRAKQLLLNPNFTLVVTLATGFELLCLYHAIRLPKTGIVAPPSIQKRYNMCSNIINYDGKHECLCVTTSGQEQVEEMRQWIVAFAEQNHTVRDYRKYFRPLMCFLEGESVCVCVFVRIVLILNR